jgi:hypothetical protein
VSEGLRDDRIRHLEMLQNAITRMAGASAAIKNLSLIVVAGALAFLAASKDPTLALFAALLTLAFWLLDARYLQQEKWFRDMYDKEREAAPSEPASFLMTPSPEIRDATGIGYGLRSWSTWGLYAPVILFLLILWFVLPGASGGGASG